MSKLFATYINTELKLELFQSCAIRINSLE